MSSTDTPVALITTAHREGSAGPTQDRVFVGTNAVVILNGAAQLEPTERDGGWLADQLGVELMRRLETSEDVDLADALRDAIASVAHRYDLAPGRSPSTTVSVVRWSPTTVDVLVLGDSPVVGRYRDGTIHFVRDDRLNRIGPRDAYEAAIASGGFAAAHRDEWLKLVDEQRSARNTPAGYWIAEADPTAADHAVRATWPGSQIEAVLLMTDGAADGVDQYEVPGDWSAAIDMATENPQGLLDAIHAAEAWDAQGTHWPRAKLHDDKATALIKFV